MYIDGLNAADDHNMNDNKTPNEPLHDDFTHGQSKSVKRQINEKKK